MWQIKVVQQWLGYYWRFEVAMVDARSSAREFCQLIFGKRTETPAVLYDPVVLL